MTKELITKDDAIPTFIKHYLKNNLRIVLTTGTAKPFLSQWAVSFRGAHAGATHTIAPSPEPPHPAPGPAVGLPFPLPHPGQAFYMRILLFHHQRTTAPVRCPECIAFWGAMVCRSRDPGGHPPPLAQHDAATVRRDASTASSRRRQISLPVSVQSMSCRSMLARSFWRRSCDARIDASIASRILGGQIAASAALVFFQCGSAVARSSHCRARSLRRPSRRRVAWRWLLLLSIPERTRTGPRTLAASAEQRPDPSLHRFMMRAQRQSLNALRPTQYMVIRHLLTATWDAPATR